MTTDRTRAFVEADVAVPVGDNGESVVARLTAPYAFVPLQEFVIPSPLATTGGPHHGRPMPDGLTGEIEVEWTFDQPVLVGSPLGANGSIFAMLPDDAGTERPALPGSTLRGLLRSFLEIATCARMTHFDADAQYAVRDFSDPQYKAHGPVPVGPGNIEAAWLTNDYLRGKGDAVPRRPRPDGWKLRPVRAHRLLTEEVLKRRKKGEDRPAFEARSVAEKYQLFGGSGCFEIRFRPGEPLASLDAASQIGYLVFTGRDPQRDDPRKSKKRCFVFEAPDDETPEYGLDAEMVRRFIYVHTTIARGREDELPDGAWDFWLDGWRRDIGLPGIPVFVIRDPKFRSLKEALAHPQKADEVFLSLSRFVKVPHRYSVGELMPPDHRSRLGNTLDFVEAFFGMVPPQVDQAVGRRTDEEQSFKGRVFVRHATLQGLAPPAEERTGVTMSPRPSFWPYYLAPAKERTATDDRVFDYSNPRSRLAGWKRYPVRQNTRKFPEGESAAIESRMQFLKATPDKPVVFRGPIRLHNVAPIEFGGLLWAITLGARDGTGQAGSICRHAIGRGKAQGFGRASGRIVDAARLERNDGAAVGPLSNYVTKFENWLVGAWNAVQPERAVTRIDDIPPIADLLAMADPSIGESVADRLVYPTSNHRKSPEETPSLAGYRLAKAAAEAFANNPERRGRRVLPAYPDGPYPKPRR